MATQAQIEANRRNALLSTGPRTPPGKAASRVNSRTHGLSGSGVVDDPARDAVAAARKELWNREIGPVTLEGELALDRAVAMSLRIEMCEDALDALAVEQATGARLDWDALKKAEAAETARGLAKDPEAVAARLEATRHGAERLIARWEGLAAALDAGAWDESDREMALDLLGVAPGLRKGRTAVEPPDGVEAVEHRRALIARELGRLRARIASTLAESDAVDRRHAEAALTVLRGKPAALILRYEREATRRFHAAIRDAKASRDGSPEAETPQGFTPWTVESHEPPSPPSPGPGRPPEEWVARCARVLAGAGKALDRDEPGPEPEPAAVEPTPVLRTPIGPATLADMAVGAAVRNLKPNRRDRRAAKALARRRA